MPANDDFPRGWVAGNQNSVISLAGGNHIIFTVPAAPGITHIATRFEAVWSIFAATAAWGGSGLALQSILFDNGLGGTVLWSGTVDIFLPAGTGNITPSGLQISIPSLPDKIIGNPGNSMDFAFAGSNPAFSGIYQATIAGYDI